MNSIKVSKDTITLQGQKINVQECFLPQSNLKFFPENPRIFSIVNGSTDEPSQIFIEEQLKVLDHVKQLSQSIRANGGLLDPIIVRDGDLVVLEGNCRLAAYRILASTDPIRWGEIKCTLLPSDIKDDLINTLLGIYHLIKRKDWAPFETAGYLWRRCKQFGDSPERIGKEMGLAVKSINRLVRVYQFMVDYKEEDPQRWSYYEEYLKPKRVQERREQYPELDKVIVSKIRSKEIQRAIDVREKVVKIINTGGKNLRKFIDTKRTLEDCFESAITRGANDRLLKNIEKFKEVIGNPDNKNKILDMDDPIKKKCKYALEKIGKSIEKIINRM